jgi:hypothetical protein
MSQADCFLSLSSTPNGLRTRERKVRPTRGVFVLVFLLFLALPAAAQQSQCAFEISTTPASSVPFGTPVVIHAVLVGDIQDTLTGYVYLDGGLICSGACTDTVNSLSSGSHTVAWSCSAEGFGGDGTGSGSYVFSVTAPALLSGYLNPKYVILGVTYAPPGPQSFVQYADSTTLGTSTSISASSSTDIGLKISVSSTIKGSVTAPDIGGIFGVSDTTTDTFSSNFTDEQDTSSSVALSSEQTWTTKVPGPVSAYVGVDHDYDVIWLWLNPLLNFTVDASGPPNLTWTGYSYDVDDVPTMDIYGIYLGWLTGHISLPGPHSSDITPLERSWAGLAANGQIWPAGTSPSLVDPTDYAAIAAADPFSKSSYTVTVPTSPAGNQTSSDGRFTLTGNQVVDYEQPGPGGQPFTQQLTETTTTTQTQGEGAKYTEQLGYSWENKFTGSILQDSWSEDVTASDTFTYINQWSKTNTKTIGVTATGSVTGPPCNVVNGLCSPVYTGPTRYEVFEDNVYGTYMFNPVNN